jgi:hypothetical protein
MRIYLLCPWCGRQWRAESSRAVEGARCPNPDCNKAFDGRGYEWTFRRGSRVGKWLKRLLVVAVIVVVLASLLLLRADVRAWGRNLLP